MNTTGKLAAMLAFAQFSLAQQGQPTTVIKTETRLVQVDVAVTDRSGNPIGDLTSKDFHLWEDKKEQTIQNVSLESHSGATAAPSYTVLFFNNASLDSVSGARVREAAAKFVSANASPSSLMAVADFGSTLVLTQNFTPDAERLRQKILGTRTSNSLADGMPATPGRGSTVSSVASRESQSQFLQAMAWLAKNLHEVPGRKIILLFGGGVPLDPSVVAVLNSTVNLCNRVNASIYPLISEGLTGEDTPSLIDKSSSTGYRDGAHGGTNPNNVTPTQTSAMTDQLLHAISKATGGYVVQNANNLAEMMAKVLREESHYYLLSYVPPESPDGTCHALTVKVDRGSDVRARSSYCNTKPVDLLARKPLERDLENRLAGDRPGDLTASMQLPFFYPEPGVAMINVAMEVPSGSIQFEKVKSRYHGEASVLGIAYAADGTAAARFSDIVSFDLGNPIEVEDFHAHPLHYEKQLRIAPGKYTFKVVFAESAGSFGKVALPLEIDPYDGQAFLVSSLALSKELHPASEMGSNFDEELMEGRSPLVYRDKRFVPFGGDQFQKSDTISIYFEIYDAAASSGAPPFDIQLRVLDRPGGEEKLRGDTKVESAEAAGKRAVPYGIRFKLDSLSSARYTAEVKVTDAAGKSMTRTADFEVR